MAYLALIPDMTADNLPSPVVVSTTINLIDAGTAAWKAFDADISSVLHSANGSTSGVVKVDLGSGNSKIATKYQILPQQIWGGRSPSAFTFEGSNDDSNWIVLDTISGQTAYPDGGREFEITNATAYRYYRWVITDNVASDWAGDYLVISGLQIYETVEEAPVDREDPVYTKLLLHMDGTENSIAFKDECGHLPLAVLSTYGNACIKTAQSKFGGASGLFDGDGDYLRSTAYVLGTKDFAIDAWIYMNTMPTSDSWPTSWSSHMVIAEVGTPSVGDGCGFVIGQTKLILASNDSQIISGTHGITTGVWHHVAVTRDGNTFRLFVDGVKIAEATNSASMGTGSYAYIGCETSQGAWFNGYMDELRISIDSPRWTADFTPPTEEYSGDEYTTMLLHMNGLDNSVVFTTNTSETLMGAGSAKILQSSPSLESVLPKLGSNSLRFDGSSHYLSVAGIVVGNSSFTVDFYGLLKTLGRTHIFYSYGGSNGGYVIGVNSSNKLQVYAGGVAILDSVILESDRWYHVALVGNGTSMKLYRDGTLVGTWTVNYNNTCNVLIGANEAAVNECLNGSIDEFRMSLGVERWTADFTPPTVEYSVDGDTDLLLHCNEAKGATTVTDECGKSVTVVGVTGASTEELLYPKFGSGMGSFRTTFGNIIVPDTNDDFVFGAEDFTIEGWFNFVENNLGYQGIIDARNNADGTGWIFYLENNNTLSFIAATSSGWNNLVLHQVGGVPELNAWMHIAVVRYGNVFTMYKNGVAVGSGTNANSIGNVSDNLVIGSNYANTWRFSGFMDEVRISKGIARWTGNFTPPTLAYGEAIQIISRRRFSQFI